MAVQSGSTAGRQPGVVAAVECLPGDWEERTRAWEANVEVARTAEIPFMSRRRARPEGAEVLVSRPFPVATPRVRRAASPAIVPSGWPAGAPPPPVRRQQLWGLDGTGGERSVSEQDDWLRRAAVAVRALEAGGRAEKVEGQVWLAELMPQWARGCVETGWVCWDQTDPEDCRPIHLTSGEQSLHWLVRPAVSVERFREWAQLLGCEDLDMLQQVGEGVLSRSVMPRDTAYMMHHQGLMRNFQPAQKSIEKDTARGWMTAGLPHTTRTCPARVVAKNCVVVFKWKLDIVTQILEEVLKWRVTTDDGLSPPGTTARNPGIDPIEWSDVKLGKPQTLAEALAMVKAAARRLGLHVPELVAERIALWAIDLSDAYRMLVVHWSELWMQHFAWSDGARLDTRCVFGAAHMVGFFQRVSNFVLEVVAYRLDLYDARFPFGAARQAWLRDREEQIGAEQRARFESIYLDDSSGLVPMAAGEQLVPCHRRESTRAGLESRPQATVRLAGATFVQAGWAVSDPKTQLGLEIGNLGIGISSVGDGKLFCPEDKRRGMRCDLAQQQRPRQAGLRPTRDQGVGSAKVDRLVGRFGHLAQIEPAGRTHMPPMYAMVKVTRPAPAWRGVAVGHAAEGRRMVRPARLLTWGEGPVQQAYQRGLAWWDGRLEQGLEVPLAPQLTFPGIGEEGVGVIFSDAAREAGTGLGAFAPMRESPGAPAEFVFAEERWSERQQRWFDAGDVSMPFGELFGMVVFAVALLDAYPGMHSVIFFTDCDAAKAALPKKSQIICQLFANSLESTYSLQTI